MLTKSQRTYKRVFDISITILVLPFLIIPLFLLVLIATVDTGRFGLFIQQRVGRNGKRFGLLKIRSLKGTNHESIKAIRKQETKFGSWLRRTKVDELPQLLNILAGDMSWVGPRPDLPGYADELVGEDSIVLSVRPGLTGPATLKYRDEDEILLKQQDPNLYNDTVIWPDKVRINKEYVNSWSLKKDVSYILASIFGTK